MKRHDRPAGRILVTGATGFVGRHVVSRLISAGQQLTLALRRADSCPPSWRRLASVRIVETGDLQTSTALAEAFRDVAKVVHLAGLAHRQGRGTPAEAFMAANARATERLVEAAAANGTCAFVHLGSVASVAGNVSGRVVDDGADGEPATPYGMSKRAAEAHVLTLAGAGRFAVNLRPPLIVGAEAKGNWKALQRLAASGLPLPFASIDNKRSLIGVSSVAQAIAHLSVNDWKAGDSGNYCIADTSAMSLPAIVTELRTGMGMPPRLLPCPPRLLRGAAGLAGQRHRAAGLLGSLEVDAGRFRRVFGFEEGVGLAESIRESGRIYKSGTRESSGAR